MGTVEGDRPLVQLERRGPVATLTLDSPHNRNALSLRLLRELLSSLREVQGDPDVRALVLTGAGPVFCSGVDLQERLNPPPAPVGDEEPTASLAEVFSCLVELPQPVIARINGAVRAGGMGLVAACDLAVAPASATFAFTEVRVGVAPSVIAVPALRVMDRRSFTRYALTGEVFGAPEALGAGLLTAVAEDFDSWVADAVGAVLRASPSAVAATKGVLGPDGWPDQSWDGALATAEALSEELFASADAAEGMAAFLDKRSPRWVVE